jgi:carbamoyl-phosphate synthase large subunit
MKSINILFLSPHWNVSLPKAFKESLDRGKLKGKLAGADSDRCSAALQFLRPAHYIPRFEEKDCIKKIMDICVRESIHAVIPLSNKAVEFLDENRQPFRAKNIYLYLQERETIAICHDKRRLAEFLTAAKILVPTTAQPGSLKNNFPLFTKRRRGEGGNNCFIVENQGELEFYSRKYPDNLFQEYLRGKEYSIDWFSDRMGNPILIVPRERIMVRNGEVWESRVHMDKGLIDATRKLGEQLSLKGPCNIQGILDKSGRFVFTDVNLRFGSGAVHTISAGGDMPLMICKEILGQSPESALSDIRDGSIMTRFHDAYFLSPQTKL